MGWFTETLGVLKKAGNPFKPRMGKRVEEPGFLGRRHPFEPVRIGDKVVALVDEDRELAQTDVDMFVDGSLALMLDSSWLASARYSPGQSRLFLTTIDGTDITAGEISMDEARDFAAAHSKGAWVWDHIWGQANGNRGPGRLKPH